MKNEKLFISYLIIAIIFFSCRQRGVSFTDIDFTKLRDGIYIGNSVYKTNTVVVEARVLNKKLISIRVLRSIDDLLPSTSAEIIQKIIETQSLNIEPIEDFKQQSLALIKAIENALKKAL